MWQGVVSSLAGGLQCNGTLVLAVSVVVHSCVGLTSRCAEWPELKQADHGGARSESRYLTA